MKKTKWVNVQLKCLYWPAYCVLKTVAHLNKLLNDSSAVNLQVMFVFTVKSEKTGSYKQIQASVGGNVTLPCNLDDSFDVTNLRVEWKVNGSITVLVYREQGENADRQDLKFKQRASFFLQEIDNRNISLKLTNVNETHSGNYTCCVLRNESLVRRCNVTLIVGEYI